MYQLIRLTESILYYPSCPTLLCLKLIFAKAFDCFPSTRQFKSKTKLDDLSKERRKKMNKNAIIKRRKEPLLFNSNKTR